MTEDDEDESFGEFYFASFPNPSTVHSASIPTKDRISTSSSSSSDSWGEFITTPKSELPVGPAHTMRPPNNNPSTVDPRYVGRVDSGKPQWVKPRGALPLSIFGELEEEEQEEEERSGAEDRDPDGATVFSNNGKSDYGRKVSDFNVNDLIANLYNQNQKIMSQNGSILNTNESDLNTNGSRSNITGSNWDSNGLGADLMEGKDSFDDDDDGWEFKAAEPESRMANGDSKEVEVLESSGLKVEAMPQIGQEIQVEWKVREHTEGARVTFGFGNDESAPGDLHVVSNGNSRTNGEKGFEFDFTSSHMTKRDAFILDSFSKSKDTNVTNGMNSPAADIEVASVENFGEFKDAFPGTGSRQLLEEPKVTDVPDSSPAVVEAPTLDGTTIVDPVDLFALSDGSSQHSKKWDSGSDFNPSSVNGIILNSYHKSKRNDLLSSPVDENVAASENFWEFENAFSESSMKHKSEEPEVAKNYPAEIEVFAYDNKYASNPKDSLGASDVVWHKSAEWDFRFSFDPVSVAQDDIASGSHSITKHNDLTSSPVDENDESGEDFGDFQDAFSVTGSKDEEEAKVADCSPATAEAPAFSFEIQRSEVRFQNHGEPLPMSIFREEKLETDDPSILQDFSAFTPTSQPRDLIRSPSSNISINDLLSSLYSQAEQNTSVTHTLMASDNEAAVSGIRAEDQTSNVDLGDSHKKLSSTLENNDSEDESGDLKAAVPGTRAEDQISNVDLGDSHKKLPSTLENNDSEDESGDLKAAVPGTRAEDQTSNVDLGDSHKKLSSTLENNDSDDQSGDSKAAVSGTRAEDQTSNVDLGDSHKKLSSTLELNAYIDFYSELKDELYSMSQCHLDNLKKAQSAAALSGEEAKAKYLEEEIQKFFDELPKDDQISKHVQSEDLSARNICFNKFLEVLNEPKFQALESEYQLSRRLSLVEDDVRSTMELLKDVASALTILKLGSLEEQQFYVSTWSEILSVCAQELEHGAFIWKQSIQKNMESQMLSEPRGKRYILALGEIYRVVEVLGASMRVYKPWILLTSRDAAGLCHLQRECCNIWSDSGLEDALKSICDHSDITYDGTIKALLESIKYIRDLDAVALQNHVVSGQPKCRLSTLTAGTVPGLRLVVWNGEQYFLTLANLWANLISMDPPDLPHIHGSR